MTVNIKIHKKPGGVLEQAEPNTFWSNSNNHVHHLPGSKIVWPPHAVNHSDVIYKYLKTVHDTPSVEIIDDIQNETQPIGVWDFFINPPKPGLPMIYFLKGTTKGEETKVLTSPSFTKPSSAVIFDYLEIYSKAEQSDPWDYIELVTISISPVGEVSQLNKKFPVPKQANKIYLNGPKANYAKTQHQQQG